MRNMVLYGDYTKDYSGLRTNLTEAEARGVDPARISCALKHLRISHNLRQEDLAQLLGVSRTTISNQESGTIPTLLNLAKISLLYDVPLDELLLGYEDDVSTSFPKMIRDQDPILVVVSSPCGILHHVKYQKDDRNRVFRSIADAPGSHTDVSRVIIDKAAKKDMGHNLRNLREKHSISMDTLSDRFAEHTFQTWSKPAIDSVELGRAVASPERLFLLSRLYGCRICLKIIKSCAAAKSG